MEELKPLVVGAELAGQPIAKPYQVVQMEFEMRNKRKVILEFNNRASMTIEGLTGISAFAFAFAPRPGFSYQAVLAFACSASWRKAHGLAELTFDEWVDHWMWHYFSADYKHLVETLGKLIASFPDAAAHKMALEAATAASQSENSLLSNANSDSTS